MGDRSSKDSGAWTSLPPINIVCSRPIPALTPASAASNRSCSSGGGSNIVAYVSLNVLFLRRAAVRGVRRDGRRDVLRVGITDLLTRIACGQPGRFGLRASQCDASWVV